MRKDTRYADKMMRVCCIDLISTISSFLKEKYGIIVSRIIKIEQIRVLPYRKDDGVATYNWIALKKGSNPRVYIHELIHWMSMRKRSKRKTCGFHVGNYATHLNEGLTEYLANEILWDVWVGKKISSQFNPLFKRPDGSAYDLEVLAVNLLFAKIVANSKHSFCKIKGEFYNAMFSGDLGKALILVDEAFGNGSFRKLFQAEDTVKLLGIIDDLPLTNAAIS